MTTQSEPKYLTVDEVAVELRCEPRAVLDALRSKRLRGTKPNKRWLVTPSDLQTYIDAHANVTKVRRSA